MSDKIEYFTTLSGMTSNTLAVRRIRGEFQMLWTRSADTFFWLKSSVNLFRCGSMSLLEVFERVAQNPNCHDDFSELRKLSLVL